MGVERATLPTHCKPYPDFDPMTVQFASTACPKVPNSLPLTTLNVKEIMKMTPGWAWVVETTYKEGRVKAKLTGHSAKAVSIPYDHAHNTGENHMLAAFSFIRSYLGDSCQSFKLTGYNSTDKGYVFMFL
jgi:hypothetical protein